MAETDNTTTPSRLCKDCRFAALEEVPLAAELVGIKRQLDDLARRLDTQPMPALDRPVVWRCTHSTSEYTPLPDLVSGKMGSAYQLRCSEVRLYGDERIHCGAVGRYWEPR
jgi:hypothetical protein